MRRIPQFGETTRRYPRGYGYCQCGCGKTTQNVGRLYGEYLVGHHKEPRSGSGTAAAQRLFNKLKSRKRRLPVLDTPVRAARPSTLAATPVSGDRPLYRSSVTAEAVAYARSSLPLTSAVARAFEELLLPLLESTYSSWAYEDRVVAWLEPYFVSHIETYYRGAGPRLERMLGANLLARMDRELLEKLLLKLDEKHAAARALWEGPPMGSSSTGQAQANHRAPDRPRR